MTVVQLLLTLRASNVKVWVSDGTLQVDAPDGKLTAGLREQLEQNADSIISYLTDAADYAHSTRYFVASDGARLAVDLFRPAPDGKVVTEPLPVIWCQDRYHRAEISGGLTVTKLDIWPWLRDVLRHGYVIAAVDSRGTGASTGSRSSEFSVRERLDAYEVTEWLAAQPWCSQRVGMFGDSYLGIAQFLAAATGPPHLKAIFPQMAAFDLYSFLYPGGVFREDFTRSWGALVRRLDAGPAAPVAGAEHLAEFIAAGHQGNADVLSRAVANRFRDSHDEVLDASPYVDFSPSGLLAAIRAAAVPVYQLSGWMDLWVRDALCWHANLAGPQRLLITADSHNTRTEVDLAAEHVRWFDYWLKDADNGMADDPAITYRVMNAAPGREWRHTSRWPPPAEITPFYFRSWPPESAGTGAEGGLLSPEPPGLTEAPDDFVVDYSASTGQGSRWAAGDGAEFGYPDLAANDRKGLTYTSPPLQRDLEVAGHPVAHVWLTSSYPDADLFVYLELVEPGGCSRYVTEGVLRGSHRALAEPPFDYLGLPYHSGRAAEVAELPATAVEFVLDLHPTACVFPAGGRGSP